MATKRLTIKKILLRFYLFFIVFTSYYLFSLKPLLASRPTYQSANSFLGTAAGKMGYDSAGGDTLEQNVGLIINTVLSLMGVIYLLLIIYGGFLWFSASGNAQQTDKAKRLLRDASIGLIIVLGAYAISYFVIYRFMGAAQMLPPEPVPTNAGP